MNASIGRSLRAPFFLLGCLAFSVACGRAEEPAGSAQAPTPPVPSKQTPPTATTTCDPCNTPSSFTTHPVDPTAPKTWTSGSDFVITLKFKAQNDYDNFINSDHGYLCYQNSKQSPVEWPYKTKKKGAQQLTCTLTVTACGLKASDGTGTGRIIITKYNSATATFKDDYQAGAPLTGME